MLDQASSPLDVALGQGDQVAGGHGQHRQDGQHLEPGEGQLGLHEQGEAHQDREARRLDGRRHEAGDIGRRTVVDVGRPHVERYHGDLETEAHQHQGRAEVDQPEVGAADRQHLVDLGEGRAAGKTVDQRHAHEQERRRETTQQQVLVTGLAAADVAAHAAHQHVHRQAHGLQTQEDGDQVVGRRQHHHAQDRKQQQRIELGAVVAVPVEAAGGEDAGQHADGREQAVEEVGEVGVDQHAAQQHAALRLPRDLQNDGADQDEHRQIRQVVLLQRAHEGVHHHHQQAAAGDHEIGQQRRALGALQR